MVHEFSAPIVINRMKMYAELQGELPVPVELRDKKLLG